MKKFARRLLSWQVLLVLLVILLAYGQTLLMYFWQDDSALIFKLMNPKGRAGSFGEGIIGFGAYKYLVTWYVPFFPIFGKEPFGYFVIGLASYGIAASSFYYFASGLFKEKKPAYLSTLLFSAGYIGGDTMFRIINSWQTNIGLILALVTFGLYIRYLRQNKFGLYLLSVLAFWVTVEAVFIRSHSLVLAILFLDIVFRLIPFRVHRLLGYTFRSIPFLAIFYKYYMTDASFGASGANSILKAVFVDGNITALSPFFANMGNVLVPNIVQSKLIYQITKTILSSEPLDAQIIWLGLMVVFVSIFFLLATKKKYSLTMKSFFLAVIAIIVVFFLNFSFFDTSPLWYRSIQTVFSGGLGMSIPVILSYLAYGLWSKDRNSARVVLVGIFIAASQFFGYFVQYPTSVFASHHRYYSHSIIGTALLFGSLSYLWLLNFRKKTTISMTPFFLVMVTYLLLGIKYQHNLVLDRSKPSRQFYKDLLTYVPYIEKGSAFYFDVANKANIGTQFGDFFSVGSMPESTALAMYYDVDRYEVHYLTNYDELLSMISSGEVKLENTYTFFVQGYNFRDDDNSEGLINTTNDFRELLSNQHETVEMDDFPRMFSTKYESVSNHTESVFEPIVINSTEIPSTVSQLVSFSMNVSPEASPKKFPYRHGGEVSNLSIAEKKLSFEYLKYKNDYYENSSVSSTSEWKFRESRNAIDRDIQTPWQGHRIWWHNNKEDALTVDLGKQVSISRLLWRNWKTALAPISYEIQVSNDNLVWKTVKTITNGPERKDGEIVIETFDAVSVRYIRMYITKTQTNDSPSILEVEVIPSKYSNVDIDKATKFVEFPFSEISNKSEWNMVVQDFSPLATVNVSWLSDDTDKYSKPLSIPIILDGKEYEYEFVLPAGGTVVRGIKIDFGFPVEGSIDRMNYSNITIDDLRERDLIIEFTDN